VVVVASTGHADFVGKFQEVGKLIFFVDIYQICASFNTLHTTRVCDYRAVLGLKKELG